MTPTPGRIVLYRLTEHDVNYVASRRERLGELLGMHPGSIGNPLTAGDQYPAIVVRVWAEAGPVQLRVMLDGEDTLWATSVQEGTGERQWQWPPRV